ncbi:MAG: exodeoxyribonuclease VII small subunit [Ruminococcaceae bacterium]|nr:exodeoxyribonuclease VII small subunit [Oscillospiraceae bacterium]
MSDLTYEQALKKLEETVNKLENEETTLDESIRLFEEGTKLVDICNSKLNTAEQKFTKLINKDLQE